MITLYLHENIFEIYKKVHYLYKIFAFKNDCIFTMKTIEKEILLSGIGFRTKLFDKKK